MLEVHRNEKGNRLFPTNSFRILSVYYAHGIINYRFNHIRNGTSLGNGLVSCDKSSKYSNFEEAMLDMITHF